MIDYTYTYGDFRGRAPSYKGSNLNDVAIDLCCGTVWTWTGSEWVITDTRGYCAIHLGSGKNLAEILRSSNTVAPNNVELYIGTDVNVPHNIKCSKNDLVIRHNIGSTIRHAAVAFYNNLAQCWVGPKYADNLMTTTDNCWSVWRDFADIVIPFKSVVTVVSNSAIVAGSVIYASDNGSSGGGVLSPADSLSSGTVANLKSLSDKLTINTQGNVSVVESTDTGKVEHYEVRLRKKLHISNMDLDENRRLRLDFEPICIVTGTGAVVHMNSIYNSSTGKYVLDFSSVSIDGLWTIIY